MKFFGILTALAVAFVSSPSRAETPSFDCAKADAAAEKLVCKDGTLAALDRELARLYDLAKAGRYMTKPRRKTLAATQVGWIKGRNDCWKAADLRECVLFSYVSRIAELRQGYANARSANENGISRGPFSVDCKGLGAGIGATFVNSEPGYVYLAWRNEARLLTQTRSGSGARYSAKSAAGDTVFWSKGNEVLFQRPGKPELKCKLEKIG